MKKFSSRLLLAMIAISLVFSVFQNCGSSSHTDLSSEGETLDVLNEKSRKVRLAHCASCHDGPGALAEPSKIMDDKWLVENRWIVPGDAQGSVLYQALFAGMPKDSAPLSDDKKGILERWIDILVFDGGILGQPAKLAISNGNTYDFGSVTTGSTADHAFTVTNQGDVTAVALAEVGLAAPFRFKGGSFPGTGATCLAVLPGKSSCTIVVEYAPSSSGNHSDTIEINYHNGQKVQTAIRNVMGSSSGVSLALLTVNPSAFNYGPVSVTVPSDKSFTVTNTGAATATGISISGLAAPYSLKGGSFPGTGGTCTTTLAAGLSCSVVVRFAPVANGDVSSTLTINYNNGSVARTVSSTLSGTGSGAGSPVYYSTVRAILNSSCTGCHGSATDESWGSTYQSLIAFKKLGQTTAAIVPGNVATSRFVKRITQNSASEPQMGVSPRGNLSAGDKQKILDWIAGGALNDPAGGTPANIEISNGPSYNFGNVVAGGALDKTFTLTNSGGTAASNVTGSGLAAPYSFKGGAFPGTGGTCGNLIPIGGNCTIAVRFAPTAPGASSDTILIDYKSGTTVKQATRGVSGTATGVPLANLTLNGGAEVDFGALTSGTTKDRTLTLANGGSARATAISGSGLNGMFSWKGGTFPGTGGTCTANLNAGASCTVVIRYAPGSAGSHSSSATVNYNNGASAQSESVNVKGTAISGVTKVYYSQVRKILTSSCGTCHNSDWGTTYQSLKNFKRPSTNSTTALAGGLESRFVKRITGTTLGTQMGTGNNGNLSSSDRAKILAWIADGMPNDPAGTLTQDFTPLLGDRYYVASVFKKVYGDHQTYVRQYVNLLLVRADTFGSACHYQDLDMNKLKTIPAATDDRCSNTNSQEIKLDGDTTPNTSTVREALRLSTCLRIANSHQNTLTALGSAALTPTSQINATNVKRMYSLFYPGEAPDPATLEDLIELGEATMSRAEVTAPPGQTKLIEAWRFIALSLCMSPGWQAP